MLLLADILPTGLFAATQALNHPKTRVFVDGSTWPPIANFGAKMKEEDRTLTFAVIGLGPVGLCACIALVDMLESLGRKWKVVGVDLNASRREKVLSIWKKMGLSDRGEYAVEDSEGAGKLVASWTQGIGFNAIIEVSKIQDLYALP
jgi:threonine dehydrogenase-like Zn-dependent dehydrogenase